MVQKFLKILQVVVQEPGQTFKPFLPSILSLCIEQVYPIVAEVRWYFLSQFSRILSVFNKMSVSLKPYYLFFNRDRPQMSRQKCLSYYTKYFTKTGGTSLKIQS